VHPDVPHETKSVLVDFSRLRMWFASTNASTISRERTARVGTRFRETSLESLFCLKLHQIVPEVADAPAVGQVEKLAGRPRRRFLADAKRPRVVMEQFTVKRKEEIKNFSDNL